MVLEQAMPCHFEVQRQSLAVSRVAIVLQVPIEVVVQRES
jgi:hypothetical protein